jgi:hypothetical protein
MSDEEKWRLRPPWFYSSLIALLIAEQESMGGRQ